MADAREMIFGPGNPLDLTPRSVKEFCSICAAQGNPLLFRCDRSDCPVPAADDTPPPPCEVSYAGRIHQHPRYPSGDCVECGALCTEGCKHPLAVGEWAPAEPH